MRSSYEFSLDGDGFPPNTYWDKYIAQVSADKKNPIKNISNECPCGIIRSICDYHKG